MSTTTSNMGLTKPSLTDLVEDTIPALSNNFQTIDDKFGILLGQAVPIETYGAKGDGITDDTAVFTAAINDHKVVHLSPGKTYLIDTINLSNITVFGNNATLVFKSVTTSIIVSQLVRLRDVKIVTPVNYSSSVFVVDTQYNDRSLLNSTIENVMMDENYNNNTDFTQSKGISILIRGSSAYYGLANLTFKNIKMNTKFKYGIYFNNIFENNNQVWCTNTLFDNFWINNSQYPIYMDYTATTTVSSYVISPIFRDIAAQCYANFSNCFAYIKMLSHSKFINCIPFDYDQISDSIIKIEPTYIYSVGMDLVGVGDLVNAASKIFSFIGSTNSVPYDLSNKNIIYKSEGVRENGIFSGQVDRSTVENTLIGTSALTPVTDTQASNGYGSGFTGILVGSGKTYSTTTLQGAFEIGTNNRGEILYRTHNGTAWSAFSNISSISRITTDRPVSPSTGTTIYDSTLGKPIWWNGSAWKDATGSTGNGYGTATIAASTTSITVTHNLGATPTFVNATPQGNIGSVWISGITSTQFVINCSSAPASGTPVSWHARV